MRYYKLRLSSYEELLHKYINHVREYEGTSFIHNCHTPQFSPEEIEALKMLEKDVTNGQKY